MSNNISIPIHHFTRDSRLEETTVRVSNPNGSLSIGRLSELQSCLLCFRTVLPGTQETRADAEKGMKYFESKEKHRFTWLRGLIVNKDHYQSKAFGPAPSATTSSAPTSLASLEPQGIGAVRSCVAIPPIPCSPMDWSIASILRSSRPEAPNGQVETITLHYGLEQGSPAAVEQSSPPQQLNFYPEFQCIGCGMKTKCAELLCTHPCPNLLQKVADTLEERAGSRVTPPAFVPPSPATTPRGQAATPGSLMMATASPAASISSVQSLAVAGGERRFKCPMCPKDYKREGWMLNHIDAKHKDRDLSPTTGEAMPLQRNYFQASNATVAGRGTPILIPDRANSALPIPMVPLQNFGRMAAPSAWTPLQTGMGHFGRGKIPRFFRKITVLPRLNMGPPTHPAPYFPRKP